jgi:hypothetical protein
VVAVHSARYDSRLFEVRVGLVLLRRRRQGHCSGNQRKMRRGRSRWFAWIVGEDWRDA